MFAYTLLTQDIFAYKNLAPFWQVTPVSDLEPLESSPEPASLVGEPELHNQEPQLNHAPGEGNMCLDALALHDESLCKRGFENTKFIPRQEYQGSESFSEEPSF